MRLHEMYGERTMMTKKDYIDVARTVAKASGDKFSIAPMATRDKLIDDLADMMAADNPRFDKDRFISECGA